MDLKKCDIKTCQCEYGVKDGKRVVFGDNQYDLCCNCYNKTIAWMEEFLSGGKKVTSSTMTQSHWQVGASSEDTIYPNRSDLNFVNLGYTLTLDPAITTETITLDPRSGTTSIDSPEPEREEDREEREGYVRPGVVIEEVRFSGLDSSFPIRIGGPVNGSRGHPP